MIGWLEEGFEAIDGENAEGLLKYERRISWEKNKYNIMRKEEKKAYS